LNLSEILSSKGLIRELLNMKKKLFVFLFVVLAVITAVSVMAIPALAGPPENAEGTWTYWLTSDWQERVGCNIFWFMTDEGVFDGTFVGTEIEEGYVTIHCNGKMSYKGDLTFTGTVDGSDPGTMKIRNVGTFTGTVWEGKWVILNGTGGLENLQGQGTWEGPPGFLEYEGNFHFEPH
jgi:hypothetical protein